MNLLILEHLLQEQGPVGILFGDRGTGGCHFALSLCHAQSARISRRGALIGAWYPGVILSGAPVFAVAMQGTALEYVVLEARGTCVPGSHGTVTIRGTILGRLPPPGHCTDSKLKHDPSLPLKDAYLLSWSFSLKDRLQVCHTSRLRRCSQGADTRGAICVLSCCLSQPTSTSRKGSSTLTLSPDFCSCCMGDTSKSPAIVVPKDCIYSYTIKAAA